MNPRSNSGFSLLEVMIASGLFIVVMAAVMQSMIASNNYVALAESQDDLTTESSRVMDAIAADVAASGWWFADQAVDYKSSATDRTLRYLPFVQIQDHGIAGLDIALGTAFKHTWRDAADARSFPALSPDIDNFLNGTPADRTALFSAALAPTVAERLAWESSFFARSQEMIFLKSSVSSWNHVGDTMLASQESNPAIYFGGKRSEWLNTEVSDAAEDAKRARLHILYTSGWKPALDGSGNVTGYTPRQVYAYDSNPAGTVVAGADANTIPYGVVMESGWLVDPNGDLSNIGVNWVTIDGRGYNTLSQDPDNLREYMFAVVASPVGLGRLVRAHKVIEAAPAADRFGVEVGQLLPRQAVGGTFYMQVDKVLSDNVMRAVFDTFRTVDAGATTASTLDFNTVRVRLYLAKRLVNSDTGTVLSRIVDRAFTMRAQNSEKDKDPQETSSNASFLGTEPIGVRF